MSSDASDFFETWPNIFNNVIWLLYFDKKMIKNDDNWTNMFYSKDSVDLVSDSIMLGLILKYNIDVNWDIGIDIVIP